MSQAPETWTCYRCTMRFNISRADGRAPQHLRCPECALPFWSATQVGGKVRVGVEPDCGLIQREGIRP